MYTNPCYPSDLTQDMAQLVLMFRYLVNYVRLGALFMYIWCQRWHLKEMFTTLPLKSIGTILFKTNKLECQCNLHCWGALHCTLYLFHKCILPWFPSFPGKGLFSHVALKPNQPICIYTRGPLVKASHVPKESNAEYLFFFGHGSKELWWVYNSEDNWIMLLNYIVCHVF